MIKMTLTFPPEVIEALRQRAEAEGILYPAAFARAIILRYLKANSEADTDNRIINVPVKNYTELKGYVDAKKLGDVEVFATYAMELAMSRAPLSEAQKAKVGKTIDLQPVERFASLQNVTEGI